MKYITVLDFEVGRVFQYSIKNNDFFVEGGDFQTEDFEAFLTEVGHRLNNCEWMIHENGDIINKTGDLPF